MVQWVRLLDDCGALEQQLNSETCTSIFEMVQNTQDSDEESEEDDAADEDEDEDDLKDAADNARMDFDEFKVGLCAAAMCKYPDPHEHLADKMEHLIVFHLARSQLL